MIMASRKYFDVLVRTPGGLKWKPVDDCLNHAEAREQGKTQYAGDILDTRFNGVKNTNGSGSSSSSSWGSGDTTWSLIVIGGGLILVISFFPVFLLLGACYGAYKLYKWIMK